MESSLSGEFLRVVEQAAIACARSIGHGDRKGSDRLAVESMRHRASRTVSSNAAWACA